MNLDSIKKIYISGIGGIGVSAIARYFNNRGVAVYGADQNQSLVTSSLEESGVTVFYIEKKENVPSDCDIYIYSPAVPESNPERLIAKEYGIPAYSYPEILAILSRKHKTIAVSGTNGKTTTTAMLAFILIKAGLDPLAIVGSNVAGWQNKNLYDGKGEYFVVEACEHKAHMLELEVYGAVITNVMEDHLDFYKDIDDIRNAFDRFVANVDKDGFAVVNYDDRESRKLSIDLPRKTSFGFSHDADVHVDKRIIDDGRQVFDVYNKKVLLGSISLSAPGSFNVYNALTAISAAVQLDISFPAIKEGLESFNGTWRRFEKLGTLNGAPVYSDYAHHPEAIQSTITATRELYPDKRIVVVFQPHQHNRTKELFDEFTQCFSGADLIYIHEIFDVAGREEEADQSVTSKMLVNKIKSYGYNVELSSDFKLLEKELQQNIQEGDVVIVMGAGDIYKVAEAIV